MDTNLTTCLHCKRELPPDCYWKGRKTCIECAQELWYSPHTDADPSASPNWGMVQRLVREGAVSFPDGTLIGSAESRKLVQKMAKLGLVKFPTLA